MTHTAGAIRAAKLINNNLGYAADNPTFINFLKKTIDRETHAAEMLAFIEKVAAWDFDIRGDCVADAQREAFELIKKVRR